ncbi:sigma-54-dependent Fis family transcriptional regulator [Ideonella sp. B7]|uniref:sigma-54-dependent Fis family transcriptional regulator n=1 Tax=Ideonella benzenivorans TaxID=2831643 RepID=UPI001CEC3317|nr:sigma-54-dependent Fis family transcriptional regulator [Ideonella benzenivorans]MCA6216083.1 sigma-54-dependent Fis family transcriptional regulator [Ideonella benzenivorans]
MFSNPRNELVVSQAWQTLLEGGELPSGAVRALVNQSWQRCAQAHVDPLRRRGLRPVSEQDLYLLQERQKDLLDAASPVMACARDYLAETGTLMALSDAHGTILVTEGDHPALDAAEAIALVPGVSWSELDCGTNAIGTALAAERPAQIHATEHFCAGIQGWTCSAAVIRHPLDGELLGTLDVSGLSGTYHRQSLAFVVNTASRIEARLAMVEMERRYRLLEHALERWSAEGQDAMVLFDRRGCPVKASAQAQRAIDAAGGLLDLSGRQPVPGLRAGRWRRGGQPGPLPDWLRGEWLEPLVVRGEYLGTLLVLPAGGRRPVPRPKDVTTVEPKAPAGFERVLTRDAGMRALMDKARVLAASQAPVLLQGETGAGKEEFARGLHGDRRGAFIALNCGGLSRELLASELFGYAEGAFTGARKGGMVGKIEAAEGGTLFLDELGELPLDMQPQLLRVLEQGMVHRLGETQPRQVRFRLVAATHRDLRQEVAAGRFRMDLYYRIAVTRLHLPPLRERPDDIPLLAAHFLQRFRAEQGQVAEALSGEVLAALTGYAWPGNVRELRNVMEAAVLMRPEGPLRPGDLGCETWDADGEAAEAAGGLALGDSLAEGEEAQIGRAIAGCGGNLTLAARRLGIAKSTLYAKMRRYGLSRDRGGSAH